MKIILASASARRKKLLTDLGLKFITLASEIDEHKDVEQIKDPCLLVQKLAERKAEAIRKKIDDKKYLIIGVDTIVVLNNRVFGKPETREEAKQMLIMLRGKTHQVLTGVALIDNQGKRKVFCETTKVVFTNFSQKDLEEYLETGVYLDRAGGYGVQDEKCNFVKSFKGSYTNILGLPIEKLNKMLQEF